MVPTNYMMLSHHYLSVPLSVPKCKSFLQPQGRGGSFDTMKPCNSCAFISKSSPLKKPLKYLGKIPFLENTPPYATPREDLRAKYYYTADFALVSFAVNCTIFALKSHIFCAVSRSRTASLCAFSKISPPEPPAPLGLPSSLHRPTC